MSAIVRDLSRSRAILISNATYRDRDIPNLPGAARCVPAMSKLLTSNLCGWPASRLTALQEVAAPSALAVELIEQVKDVQDVLLLYYVGHGMRTSDGKLALALADSYADSERLPHTAITYEGIARILRRCPATTKIVILDCCHAELANRVQYQFQSAEVIDAEPVDGLYFIGASRMRESARSPLDGGLPYFTEAFIDVVRDGIPGKPAQVTIDQIFTELRSRLIRASRPEPVQSGIRDAHHWPFARNAAPPQTHRDLEAENATLARQLAEARSLHAASEVRMAALRSEVSDLKTQLNKATTARSKRELQNAIDSAERQIEDTASAANTQDAPLLASPVAPAADEDTAVAPRGQRAAPDQAENARDRLMLAAGPAGPTRDEGITLTGPIPWAAERDAADARLVPVEWALWERDARKDGHVIRCSDGALGPADFHRFVIRFASGVKETLPQYTLGWIPDSSGGVEYLAVGIHELADKDPARSGGRVRASRDREIEYIRLFCVRYVGLALHRATYSELVGAVRDTQLPAELTGLLQIQLPELDPPHFIPAVRGFAGGVAALLLTTRPVYILGAVNFDAIDRLRFIDYVMSLLPYGLRATFSASTWASATARDLKVRLFFSNARRAPEDGTCLHWLQSVVTELYAADLPVRHYANWLEHGGGNALAELADQVDPVRFTAEDVYRVVDNAPRPPRR